MITIYDNDYNTHEYFKNFSSEERASFNEEYEELLKSYPIGKHDGMIKE
jgi:phosphate:Na+ symporter